MKPLAKPDAAPRLPAEPVVRLIIPALNEADSLPHLLASLPAGIDEVIVVDNGSSDATAQVAHGAGARVVSEPRRGYGQACLTGIAALRRCDVIVFLDADLCDDPARLGDLVQPIFEGRADMVLGTRMYPEVSAALTLPQRFGNRLACRLMRLFWGGRYTDLGPFRAISPAALQRLGMRDRDFGWTVEMQIKAARIGLSVREIPVPYRRRRFGRSKVSGTVSGVVGAGYKILYVIFREALFGQRIRRQTTARCTTPHRRSSYSSGGDGA